MFSNNRKTIGVFEERALSEFQNKTCQGIVTEAEKLGYNVAIFSPYGNYGRNERFFEGELELYQLPEYEKLDGIIMALDTMEEEDSRREILKNVRGRCECPVVSIREIAEGANNLLVDNTICMEGIIRHFIEKHGFTKLCFMTGPTNHWDAMERLMCFKRVMSEYHLPVEDHQMFFGDFWKHKGKEACNWFLKKGRPEAIICANDHMALSVASELIRRGFRVPEDICVSGYDGLDDTLSFTPSITTVEVPFFDIGRKAVEIIDEKQDCPKEVEDYYFEAQVIPRESCGCLNRGDQVVIETRRNQYEAVGVSQNRELQFNFMSLRLGEYYSIDEIGKQLTDQYVFNIEGLQDYCCCFVENLEEREEFTSYTETMEMRVGVKNTRGMGQIRIPFSKQELLPAAITSEKPQIWYFAPLHFQSRTFGYEAMQFQSPQITGQLHLHWNIILGNKFQDVLVHHRMRGLIRELENMYDRDALTGMYNRRGFEDHGGCMFNQARLKQEPIFLSIIDLDGMKEINDNYGHIEGDAALRKVCEVIQYSCGRGNINARTGGDEFIVIADGIHKQEGISWMKRLDELLELYNGTEEKEYDIHASYGFIWKTPEEEDSLETYIKQSDEMMYLNKAANKARRHEAMR